MQYTYPDYYNQFSCLADRCPQTCCAGWQIVIDPESLKKYQKYQEDGNLFGNRLYNGIDWQEGVFYQSPDGRCDFLDEENLCDIYREAGAEMLCITCQTYPRHIEEFEEVREISLCLSCPEAARIILENQAKVTFISREDDEEEEYEDFDYFLFSCLIQARDGLLEIMQNRSLPIYSRMAMVLQYAKELQKCIDEDELYKCEELNSDTGSKVNMIFIKNIYQPDFMKSLWEPFLTELEVLKDSWPEYITSCMEQLYEHSPVVYQEKISAFEQSYKAWETECEQIMVYWIYTYFCGAVYDQDAYGKMQLALVSTLLIRELAAAHYDQTGYFSKECLIDMCVSYSRELEHSDKNLEAISEYQYSKF